MAKTNWQETGATVASVVSHQYRSSKWYTVVFTYKVNGHWYGGTFTSFQEHREGDWLAVKYDPDNPDRNYLVERKTKARWLAVAVLVLLAIVAISCWMWLKRS